jgi:CRP/FNR family cyclic AMP-dependent transcriptional regulator
VIEGVPAKEHWWPLARVDILASLTPEEIERLALLSASVHLGAGETFALDEERRALLLLASGWVRVREPSAAGPGLTISMVEDPTVVTQTGFVVRPSRAEVVEALEPSVLRVLEWEVFEDVVRRNPEVGVKTIRLLGERLSTCEGRLSDLVRKAVPARLATLVLGLSEHQGVVTAEGDRIILTRYTHQELASMVGSNREAVTRAFRKLKEAGAVETEGRRIYVTDADALERLANAER